MTKFILHGGFTSAGNELNKSFYREMTKDLSEDATILLVYFAKDHELWPKLFEEDKERIIENSDLKHLKIISATEKEFAEQVRSADAIYIRGGDTERLIDTLRKYPTFIEDIQRKVIAGSSAGAYVCSTFYYSGSKGAVFEGLGLLPIRIICHFMSETLPNHGDDAMELMEGYNEELELVVLRDYEWRVFEVERVESGVQDKK